MQSHTRDLLSQLNVLEIDPLPLHGKANALNSVLLEPLSEYQRNCPPNKLPLEECPSFLQISEDRVLSLLVKLNSTKASGPDGISNRFLKDYAALVASPFCMMINASFREQSFPTLWKRAEICPLPKKKVVENPPKDLRPISLTLCISKVAKNFVVRDYLKPAILKIVDYKQFGVIPKSSTTLALVSMIHRWLFQTDGNGATIRIILFDYRKAFDLIPHEILAGKLCSLDLPDSVVNWIMDFISDRYQRIKLADDCFSEWRKVP